MEYKGFTAGIKYDSEDNTFVGTILAINSVVAFEGTSIFELNEAFKQAVDYHIVFCKKNNIEPHKHYSGSFNVRVSSHTHRKLASNASILGITLNAYIKNILDDM